MRERKTGKEEISEKRSDGGKGRETDIKKTDNVRIT
jgi:hypothetical protein